MKINSVLFFCSGPATVQGPAKNAEGHQKQDLIGDCPLLIELALTLNRPAKNGVALVYQVDLLVGS